LSTNIGGVHAKFEASVANFVGPVKKAAETLGQLDRVYGQAIKSQVAMERSQQAVAARVQGTERAVKAANAAFDRNIAALDKAIAATAQYDKAATNAARSTEKLGKAAASAGKDFDRRQWVKGTATELKSWLGLMHMAKDAVTGLFEAAREGAQNEAVETFFKRSGKSIEEYRKATLGMVSDANLMKKANLAEVMGINEGAFKKLAMVAKAAALKTGQSYQFMFDSIMSGTARSSKPILDNLGLIVSAETANLNYAKSLLEGSDAQKYAGMTAQQLANSLSDTGKRAAFIKEVLLQANPMMKEFAEIGNLTSTSFDQAAAAMENLADEFKKFLAQALGPIMPKVTEWFRDLRSILLQQGWEGLGRTVASRFAQAFLSVLAETNAMLMPWTESGGAFSAFLRKGAAGFGAQANLQANEARTSEIAAKNDEWNKTREMFANSVRGVAGSALQIGTTFEGLLRDYDAHNRGVLEGTESYKKAVAVLGAAINYMYGLNKKLGFAPLPFQPGDGPTASMIEPKTPKGGRAKKTKPPWAYEFSDSELKKIAEEAAAATPFREDLEGTRRDLIASGGVAFDSVKFQAMLIKAWEDAQEKIRIHDQKINDRTAKLREQMDKDAEKRRAAEARERARALQAMVEASQNTASVIADTFFAALQGRSIGRTLDRHFRNDIAGGMTEALEGVVGPLGALTSGGASFLGGAFAGIIGIVLQLIDSLDPLLELVEQIVTGLEQLIRNALGPLFEVLKLLGPPLFHLLAAIGILAGTLIDAMLPLVYPVISLFAALIDILAAAVIVISPFLPLLVDLFLAFVTLGLWLIKWLIPLSGLADTFLFVATTAHQFAETLVESAIGFYNAVAAVMRKLGISMRGLSREDIFGPKKDEGAALRDNTSATTENTAAVRDLAQELRNLPQGYRVQGAVFNAQAPLEPITPMIGVTMETSSPFLQWRRR